MADLDNFLMRAVEGYIFEDMKTMKAATLGDGRSAGALGYPLIMATFAGIELLGVLVSDKEFTGQSDQKDFCRFWEQYLYSENAARKDVGQPLYLLLRNGLAHGHVARGGIEVTKGAPDEHLLYDENEQTVYIDACQLADDFMECYGRKIKRLLEVDAASEGPSRATMNKRLEEMTYRYGKMAGCKLCDKLKALPSKVSKVQLSSDLAPADVPYAIFGERITGTSTGAIVTSGCVFSHPLGKS